MTLMSSQTVAKHYSFLQLGFLCDSSLKRLKQEKKKKNRKRKHFLQQLWCFVLTHLFEFHLDAFLKEGNFQGWCLTEPTDKRIQKLLNSMFRISNL